MTNTHLDTIAFFADAHRHELMAQATQERLARKVRGKRSRRHRREPTRPERTPAPRAVAC
jgi:hypothetical protein